MNVIEVVRRPKTPLEKCISLIVNILCIAVVVLCSLVCIATLNCRTKGVVTSIGGYSAVSIAPTGSMVASGFNTGDVVLVKKVNPKSLKGDQFDRFGNITVAGDIIAFYRAENHNSQNCLNMKEYTKEMALQQEEDVDLTFSEFIGSQNPLIERAGRKRASMIFHHIKQIRQDANGKLYFQTYGSSNPSTDILWISEDAIVGKYYEEASPLLLTTFKTLNTPYGIFVLISIPLVVVIPMVFLDILKSLELAGMEYNVLNGKLSLTDPVCVANHIGYKMSNKSKFKVLAQLSPQERIEAVSYLWQSPKDVENMKKHYIKQKLLLHYDEERAALKAEYTEIFKENPDSKKHVKDYQRKLDIIDKKEEETIKRIKQITKNANTLQQNEIYNQMDNKINLKNAKVKLKKGESLHIGPHKSVEAKKIVQSLEKAAVKEIVKEDISANVDVNEAVSVFNNAPKSTKTTAKVSSKNTEK